MDVEKYDFIVMGGGVSGLGFAKRVSENGKLVLVLEKELSVGGLSRSLNHKGFFLDFCAHRFHTNNKDLLREIRGLDGLNMISHNKRSRIYMFGKYLKYPFELESLLRAMPLSQSIAAGFSFTANLLTRKFKTKNKLNSYKDWFIYLYGKKLYQIMCHPYTSKLWHVDPALLSADWADQRFKTEDLVKLTKRIIKKIITFNFRSYNLEEDSLAPDGGTFYYPLKGIQEMSNAIKKAAIAKGAKIECGIDLTSIGSKNKIIEYRQSDGTTKRIAYNKLISTIPLHTLYKIYDRNNSAIEKALGDLKYMDIVFVYLFLNQDRISNDHWLYFPDTDIIFNRAVEFSNWSPQMCPAGTTSICFDITGFNNTPELKLSDKELTDRVIKDARRVNYLKKTDKIADSLVFRVKYAYPFYDLDYRKKLDSIVSFFEEDKNIRLLGRTGIFRYNNSDNSIEMGFLLAESMLKGDDLSLNNYSVKKVSF